MRGWKLRDRVPAAPDSRPGEALEPNRFVFRQVHRRTRFEITVSASILARGERAGETFALEHADGEPPRRDSGYELRRPHETW